MRLLLRTEIISAGYFSSVRGKRWKSEQIKSEIRKEEKDRKKNREAVNNRAEWRMLLFYINSDIG